MFILLFNNKSQYVHEQQSKLEHFNCRTTAMLSVANDTLYNVCLDQIGDSAGVSNLLINPNRCYGIILTGRV